MKTATLKFIASGIVLAVLSACGGGGEDASASAPKPTHNYAALSGTFDCTRFATGHTESFQATFTESSAHLVSITFPGKVVDVNDVIGEGNGYPMYSEFIPSSTDARSLIFTTDGVLAYGVGPQSRIKDLYVDALTVYTCKKQ